MIHVEETDDKRVCNIDGNRSVIEEELTFLFNQMFYLDKNMLTRAVIRSKYGQYVMSDDWKKKTE